VGLRPSSSHAQHQDYRLGAARWSTTRLAKLRYEASIRRGFQESFSAMFPARASAGWMRMVPAADLRALPHETLIIHGREGKVIPLSTSLTLADGSPTPSSMCSATAATGRRSSTAPASRLVGDFLAEADQQS
jgi:2-hydroxymuconate-semialdehyde hydrolase